MKWFILSLIDQSLDRLDMERKREREVQRDRYMKWLILALIDQSLDRVERERDRESYRETDRETDI